MDIGVMDSVVLKVEIKSKLISYIYNFIGSIESQ